MKYRKGYKYQLAADEHFATDFRPPTDIITTRIELYTDGRLVVREGYAFDGVSGPTIDRNTTLPASAGHDALYELMRRGLLPHRRFAVADDHFIEWIKRNGAWRITQYLYAKGLKIVGGSAALPKNRKRVYDTLT